MSVYFSTAVLIGDTVNKETNIVDEQKNNSFLLILLCFYSNQTVPGFKILTLLLIRVFAIIEFNPLTHKI